MSGKQIEIILQARSCFQGKLRDILYKSWWGHYDFSGACNLLNVMVVMLTYSICKKNVEDDG